MLLHAPRDSQSLSAWVRCYHILSHQLKKKGIKCTGQTPHGKGVWSLATLHDGWPTSHAHTQTTNFKKFLCVCGSSSLSSIAYNYIDTGKDQQVIHLVRRADASTPSTADLASHLIESATSTGEFNLEYLLRSGCRPSAIRLRFP
jgi:hypothetical protein